MRRPAIPGALNGIDHSPLTRSLRARVRFLPCWLTVPDVGPFSSRRHIIYPSRNFCRPRRHARTLRGKWTPGLSVRSAPAIFAECRLRRRLDIDARPRLAGSVIENFDNPGYSLSHQGPRKIRFRIRAVGNDDLSPQSHVIQIPVISLASLPGRWLCNETALHRCSRVHHAALQSERPQNELRTFNAPQSFQGQRRIARKLLIRYGKSWSG